jgi:hypothetical protein
MSMVEIRHDGGLPLLSPILCTIPHAAAAIGDGRIEAVKSNKRTLVVVESLRKYVAGLERAKIKPPIRRRIANMR